MVGNVKTVMYQIHNLTSYDLPAISSSEWDFFKTVTRILLNISAKWFKLETNQTRIGRLWVYRDCCICSSFGAHSDLQLFCLSVLLELDIIIIKINQILFFIYRYSAPAHEYYAKPIISLVNLIPQLTWQGIYCLCWRNNSPNWNSISNICWL